MLRLKNILSFVGLVPNVPSVKAHGLNWNGRAVLPDLITLDESGYTVVADATNVTVTRLTGPAAVNMLVESWHSIERAFGAKQTIVLNPQPLVIQGAGATSAASTSQVFRYVADGTESDTIVIGAAQGFVARPNANYNVQITRGELVGNFYEVAAPPSLFHTTDFTLRIGALKPTAGDSFLFTVEDLS